MDIPSLDRYSISCFASASISGYLEWAFDSIQDISLGRKLEDYLQFHSGFYLPLVRSHFIHQSQLDPISPLSYCLLIFLRSCRPCLRRDPSFPCTLHSHAQPFP